MITQSEYQEALQKVMDYAIVKQQYAKTPSDVGCRVKLSTWGIEMQGKSKKKSAGTILAWTPWMNYPNDGTVTVKWDKISKPEDMHISHVELI